MFRVRGGGGVFKLFQHEMRCLQTFRLDGVARAPTSKKLHRTLHMFAP